MYWKTEIFGINLIYNLKLYFYEYKLLDLFKKYFILDTYNKILHK